MLYRLKGLLRRYGRPMTATPGKSRLGDRAGPTDEAVPARRMKNDPLKLEEIVDAIAALRRELTALTADTDNDGSGPAVRAQVLKAAEAASRRRPRRRGSDADGGRRRHRLRGQAVVPDGRDHRRALRLRRHPRLPLEEPFRRRTHGRHRGRRLRSRHAGARLRHRPAVPAALQADALGRAGRRVHALHAVGPRPEGRPRHPQHRGVHPAVALRHHHPHLDPGGAPPVGRGAALPGTARALRPRRGAQHRRGIRPGQARRARRTPPQGRREPLSRRAQHQGRQGRPARPAHAVLDRQVFLPRAQRRGTGREGRLHARGIQPVPQGRGLPLGGALPHAFPHRQGRGAPAFRHPARGRRPARLHQPSGPFRRRALHEALLPDRQGRRRPHPHLLRRGRGGTGEPRVGLQPAAAVVLAQAPQACRHLRLHRRQPPHQHRRPEGVRARSGEPASPVLVRRPPRAGIPSRRDQAGDAFAEAWSTGRCGATRRRTGCSSTSSRRTAIPNSTCAA